MDARNEAERSGEVLTGGPAAREAGGVLTLDLGAIVANWRDLASRTAPAECAAVVKADAYGCGIEPVAGALARAGCKTFFVADVAEARRLRATAPDADIYVLNGIPFGAASALADVKARPVIGSLSELAEWDAFCTAQQWRGGAALHFDTGMNRLGLLAEDASALAARVKMPDHGVSLVMSHFACADTPNHPMNQRQIDLFREVRTLFRGIPASLANSSGIFLGASAHCDMVRPGIALFGGNPTPSQPNPMKPVVELKGRIAQVRTVARGDSVGYGAAWTAAKPTRIAVVAIGYADGYARAASGVDGRGGEVLVAGHRCRIAGRISMDLMSIDLSNLPDGAAKRGDYVTLIGGGLGVDEVAAMTGTVGYEVLTNLGRRFHRVWTR